MCILYPTLKCDIIALEEVQRVTVSKAQQKATAKYVLANYDEIKIRTSKGQKEIIKARADDLGESVNGYINRLITEDLKKAGD